jgi:raffinose/stachyose/melibiose transport system substrate-binding protein
MGWAIPARSQKKDAAAAYIDFISSAKGMKTLEKNNQLPAVPSADAAAEKGTLTDDILTTWSQLTQDNGLVAYMDWSTPTFYETIVSNVQSLMGGHEDTAAFTKALQADYAGFDGGN